MIQIRNPRPPTPVAKRHGMALQNTRARIEYHFGLRGGLKIDSGADSFTCTVHLPVDEGDHAAKNPPTR
jgi:two-component system sensor histidine kinase AlgZ